MDVATKLCINSCIWEHCCDKKSFPAFLQITLEIVLTIFISFSQNIA